MKKWMVYSKKADFAGIGQKFNVDPVIARVMRNRDVIGDEAIRLYLYGTKDDFYSASQMKDIKKAVDILNQKIAEGRKIRVIGDYDIDGVTSLYILLTAFRRLGANVDGEIPHRMKDGYGINERLIQEAYDAGVDTIVTCDNGISAISQIAYAKSLGMTVVITDHHDIPYEEKDGRKNFCIPQADAVVNPKQADCPYPFKGLCGAGVAYKLVDHLYEANRIPREKIWEFLEFAAIGTVGDVMELQGENRLIVKEGLEFLRRTKNLGLRSLMEVNGIDPVHVNAYHIGFVIGPCLNAGGRLDTAKRALSLLMTENKQEADEAAGELKALNDSRKQMTKQGVNKAAEEIEQGTLKGDHVLVVYLQECHESLAGIIAGRLRERYYRPTLVLTKGEEGIKGSGRSIPAYSMFDELVKVKEYLQKFGGHPMAAGFSLNTEDVESFRKALNERQHLSEEELIERIWIDVPMPISYITPELVKQMECLEPFGKGNEKPVFADRNIRILQKRVVGQNQNAVKLKLVDKTGKSVDGIFFGDAWQFMKDTDEMEELSILYYPSLNEFRGITTVQVVVTGYQGYGSPC